MKKDIGKLLAEDEIATKKMIKALYSEYQIKGHKKMVELYPKKKAIFDDWLSRKI